MGLYSEVQRVCDLCRKSFYSDADAAPEIYEIRVLQIGPESLEPHYHFVVCRACKWWAVEPLLKIWADNRASEEIESIQNEMADFALNEGGDH